MARLTATGCMACRIRGVVTGLAFEVHHQTDCGRRLGHMYTVSLCQWHHRGVVPLGITVWMAEKYFGPSLANGSKTFKAAFGSDAEMLAMQNDLLEMR